MTVEPPSGSRPVLTHVQLFDYVAGRAGDGGWVRVRAPNQASLLAFLALTSGTVHLRATAAERLGHRWHNDEDPLDSRRRLRRTLNRLGGALGMTIPAPRDRDMVGFERGAVDVDALTFRTDARQMLARLYENGDDDATVLLLDRLLETAARPLLPELGSHLDPRGTRVMRAGGGNRYFEDARDKHRELADELFDAACNWAAARRRSRDQRRWMRAWDTVDPVSAAAAAAAETARLPSAQTDDDSGRIRREAVPLLKGPLKLIPVDVPSYFVGRGRELDEIEQSLHAPDSRRVNVISGLRGIGKTQLAACYAHAHADYQVRWWLRASRDETLFADLTALARIAGLSMPEPGERELLLRDLRTWLADPRTGRWLLVFDNAERASTVTQIFPEPLPANGHVLITSAVTVGWDQLDPGSRELDALQLVDALRLMEARTGQKADRAMRDLCNELGMLPLALDQAAASIAANELTSAEYLDGFRRQLPEVFGHTADHSEATISQTLKLAIQDADGEHSEAQRILQLAAFLAPDALPDWLFADAEPLLAQGIAADDYIAAKHALRQFSLITRLPDNDGFGVHRLVQTVVRSSMRPAARADRIRTCCELLLSRMSSDEPRSAAAGDRARMLVAHAETVAEHAVADGVEFDAAAELCSRAGLTRRVLSEWQGALRAHRQAHAIDTRNPAADPARVGRRLLWLARILRELTEFDESVHLADSAYEQLLDAHNGDPHHDVAAALNVVAVNRRIVSNDPDAARRLHEQALSMQQKVLSADNPHLAKTLNYLAVARRQLGDLDGAEAASRAAIDICRAALPDGDLQTATHLRTLGTVLRDKGQLREALELQRQALTSREQTLGAWNTNVGRQCDATGRVLFDIGRFAQAAEHFERARLIGIHALGPDHPHVATALVNLGATAAVAGDHSLALERLTEAVEIFAAAYEDTIGPRPRLRNLDTAWAMLHLSIVQANDGAIDKAARQMQEVLRLRRERLDDGHHHIGTSLYHLGEIARLKQEPQRAEALHRDAYTLRRKTFGDTDHPRIADSLERLGCLAADTGSIADAIPYWSRCLEIRQRQLEPQHPALRRVVVALRAGI